MDSSTNRDLTRQVISLTRDPNFSSRIDELYAYTRRASDVPEPPPPPPGEIFAQPHLPGYNPVPPPPPGEIFAQPHLPGYNPVPPPPPGEIFRASKGESFLGAMGKPVHSQVAPPRNDSIYGSQLGSRGLFSSGENSFTKPSQQPYDQAMALITKDESFSSLADIPNEDEIFVSEVEKGPYDPNSTVAEGIQRSNLYLLMKNDAMLAAKSVENMMNSAAYIWQNIYNVALPMIKIPEKPKEFVFFKMRSLEDKMQALSMSQNSTLKNEQKLFFMGKPTHIKDVAVAPLPFVMAQPGTRQEALDALMPLRSIPYEVQIKARADSMKNMFRNVVLSARKSLHMPAGAHNQMACCFFDEPDLEDIIPMATSSGFARFTTVEFGYHPSTGEPVPGIRVYYGPDEAPFVYLLTLEDCTHISRAILKTVDDLFKFLIYQGFAIFDPKYDRGDLLKFRVLMNTCGKMIITVELALDDDFAGSFEEVVTRDDNDPSLMIYPRALYQPEQEPPLIQEYPFMKENSLDVGPPNRDLMKYGGVEQLCRIRPALQTYYREHGQALGVDGIYVTWYYVNERPVEWNRNSRIWHHACGADFVSEVILDVTLPMYPHICSPHFPHTQAFPKILKEIFVISKVNKNSRIIILSEYLFLAEFFGQKCQRTIFLKNEITVNERDYLERTLPIGAIKFLSPNSKPSVELLEPGGDVVIIWGGNRRDKLLRNLGFSNYRLVIFVRDGLRRVHHDKKDTFVALHQLSKCLFPYMALNRALAIDVEPQGNTMPAIIALFTKAPYSPKIPEILPGAPMLPMASKVPTDRGAPPFLNRTSQPRSVSNPPLHNTPQHHKFPGDRSFPQNSEGPFGTREDRSSRFGRRDGYLPREGEGEREFGFQRGDPPKGLRGVGDFQRKPDGDHHQLREARGIPSIPDFGFQRDDRLPKVRSGEFGRMPDDCPPRDGRGNRMFGFQPDVLPLRDARGNRDFGYKFGGPPPSKDTRENRDYEFHPDGSHRGAGRGNPDFRFNRDNPIRTQSKLTPREIRQTPFKRGDPEVQSICQYILDMGGPDHIETMPLPNPEKVCGWSLLEAMQKSIANQKRNGGVNQLPLWYRTFLSDNGFRIPYNLKNHASHYVPEPPLELLYDEEVRAICTYIMDMGGPECVETMPLPDPHKVRGSEKLAALQKSLENQKRNGGVNQLPKWYLSFLIDNGFQIPYQLVNHASHPVPGEVLPPKASNEMKIEDFIFQNGGHKEIENMVPDHSVANWKSLASFQKQLRNQKYKGGISFYPIWYHKYLLEYEPNAELHPGVTRPKELTEKYSIKTNQGQNVIAHSDVNRSDVDTPKHPSVHTAQEIGKYIMANGGPAAVETMPLPNLGEAGRNYLVKLQKSLRNQRLEAGYGLVQQLPMWYLKFLAENGFNAKELYPHLREHPTHSLSGKPTLCEQDRTAEEILNDKKTQVAIQYIMDHGGPDCIETMPMPSLSSGPGLRLVAKLKKSIASQKLASGGKVHNIPQWYILFLMMKGLPVISDQYVDASGFARKIPKDGGPLDPPPFDFSTYHPPVAAPINRADNAPPELIDYIKRNGGHLQIESMEVDRSVRGFKKLESLQRDISYQKTNLGGLRKYPVWYRNYVAEHEPQVVLPLPSQEAEEGLEPPAKIAKMDYDFASDSDFNPENQPAPNYSNSVDFARTENPNKVDPTLICEYIKNNGGHANLDSMKVDKTVEGWKLLMKIQKQMRNMKNKGAVVFYPNWYRQMYLPKYEPDVVLPNPGAAEAPAESEP